MSEEELQQRRERHDLEMAKIRVEIEQMRRETRFPPVVLAATVLGIVSPLLAFWIAS